VSQVVVQESAGRGGLDLLEQPEPSIGVERLGQQEPQGLLGGVASGEQRPRLLGEQVRRPDQLELGPFDCHDIDRTGYHTGFRPLSRVIPMSE
jgi:hypothetical protein